MLDAFRLGGWGMYPTTIIGLVLIGTGLRQALRPEARRLAVIRGLSLLVMLSGSLGFVTGVIKTFTNLGGLDLREAPVVALIGVGESLTNIGLALVILIVAWIATTAGAARGGSRDAAELTAV
jgi:hypothetical protein